MDGDFLVDDLAGFMAIMVANARNLDGQKGLLGVANWISEQMLAAAHARRSNTREGESQIAPNQLAEVLMRIWGFLVSWCMPHMWCGVCRLPQEH